MPIRDLSLCVGLGLGLVAAALAEPPPGAGSAASQPASAAQESTNAAKGRVEVHVRYGEKKPGKPAPAKLEFAGTNLNDDIAAGDVGKFAAVPKGKVSLKVFVPGAEWCTLPIDVAGGKSTTVKVFVPKRGLGLKCERVVD